MSKVEIMSKYEVIIGLEVHVQLNTKSKLFCFCKNGFGGDANSKTCPICQGHPGVLPVLNKEAFVKAIEAGIALNCTISTFCRFDRKNYFYPDLPKAYQITQYDFPICKTGYLNISIPSSKKNNEKQGNEKQGNGEKDKEKRIRINRIHIEEDAGKLVHEGDYSYIDLNRSGVALLEIVSEPDIRSSEEAYIYLNDLKDIISYVDVSDCNMEEGSLRCDANVSLREYGESAYGKRVEIKNLNSFRGVQKALDYEIKRQGKVLSLGEEVVQETRLYNVDDGKTYNMRDKGDANDYRYFPEPDLVPVVVREEEIEKIRSKMPELPKARLERFAREYKISEKDAKTLTTTKALADYFEESLSLYGTSPKKTANWITAEFLRHLNDVGGDFSKVLVNKKHIADIVRLIDEGVISGKIGKMLFESLTERSNKEDIKEITIKNLIEEKGLKLISNEEGLTDIILKVIEENPNPVKSYKSGKEGVLGFLVGQVMKETKGQANPAMVNKVLRQELEKL